MVVEMAANLKENNPPKPQHTGSSFVCTKSRGLSMG